MKENIEMIKNVALEFIVGLQEISLKANLKMI